MLLESVSHLNLPLILQVERVSVNTLIFGLLRAKRMNLVDLVVTSKVLQNSMEN